MYTYTWSLKPSLSECYRLTIYNRRNGQSKHKERHPRYLCTAYCVGGRGASLSVSIDRQSRGYSKGNSESSSANDLTDSLIILQPDHMVDSLAVRGSDPDRGFGKKIMKVVQFFVVDVMNPWIQHTGDSFTKKIKRLVFAIESHDYMSPPCRL